MGQAPAGRPGMSERVTTGRLQQHTMGGPSRNSQRTGYSCFCCCVTSDHKLSGLSSPFLWVGLSGHSLAGSSAQGLSKAVTKSSARLGSQLKARLGKDRFQMHEAAGRTRLLSP